MVLYGHAEETAINSCERPVVISANQTRYAQHTPSATCLVVSMPSTPSVTTVEVYMHPSLLVCMYSTFDDIVGQALTIPNAQHDSLSTASDYTGNPAPFDWNIIVVCLVQVPLSLLQS